MTGTRTWFDRRAARYNSELFSPRGGAIGRRYDSLMALLPAAARDLRGRRVLEIGAGTGLYTRCLATEAAGMLVSGDVSAGMLDAHRQAEAGGVPVCCGAEALPFAGDSFDLVAAFACLHHVEDSRSAFREAARVLGEGGHLLVMEPNPLHPLNALLGLARPVERGMLRSWPSRWVLEAELVGLGLVEGRVGAFFPGWPAVLETEFRRWEPALEAVPGLRRLGIFWYGCFRK